MFNLGKNILPNYSKIKTQNYTYILIKYKCNSIYT